MLRVDARLAWQVLAGEAILVNLGSGRAIGLNETGTFIWERIQNQTEAELADALVREFSIDLDSARRDLTEFVGLLKSEGYLLETA